jgi:hypothetical protein
MRRTSLIAATLISTLTFVALAFAQQEKPRRPAAPMMTSDDVLTTPPSNLPPIESDFLTTTKGSPVKNPRAILENAITKMSELNSVRTRMQSVLASESIDVVIESMKPDRMHVTWTYGEMISIGRKFYVKGTGGWSVTSVKPPQSDALLDFRALVKQLIEKSRVTITGYLLGPQTVDGIDTVTYTFEVNDGNEFGKIDLYLGKDGYIRQMFLSGRAVNLKMWFNNLNEPLSIEPPM